MSPSVFIIVKEELELIAYSGDLVMMKRHQHDIEMVRDNSKEVDVKEIDERILRSIYTDELEQ